MGMFDSVMFDCPNCGREIEAQSKSGECTLARYSPDDVPLDVAADIDRHAPFKCECGKSWRLVTKEQNRVSFAVVESY